MQNTEIKIQLEILIKEYPSIKFTSDSNIERYFELRKNGKTQEALAVYNAHIRITYPDEAFRTELMKAYRSRSADFVRLLHVSIIQKAQQLAHNIMNVITLLIDDISALNLNDAYTVIRRLDHMLLSLSHNKFEAISKAEKLKLYAHMLSFREKDMEHVVAVLRLYVTDGMAMVQDFKKNVARVQHQHRQQQLQRNVIDFKKMQFSDYDVARIIIAPSIKRPEDKVLAYCIKYWNMVFDANFERTIYLYSKKYESRHYDIFAAIKRGKTMKRRDEEILNVVLSFVTSGYYYNINGDLYLQQMWYRVKAYLSVSAGNSRSADAVPALPSPKVPATKADSVATKTPTTTKPATSPKTAEIKVSISKSVATKASAQSPATTKSVTSPKVPATKADSVATKTPTTTKPATLPKTAEIKVSTSKSATTKASAQSPATAKPAALPKTAEIKVSTSKSVATKASAQSPATAKPATSPKTAEIKVSTSKSATTKASAQSPATAKPAASPKVPATKADSVATKTPTTTKPAALPKTAPAPAPTVKENVPTSEEHIPYPSHIIEKKATVYTESVSDIIKRVSDTPYDLYKDLFFAQVRPSIRAVLSKNKIKKSLFDANQNKGEEILYIFLQDNYENPFMNWTNSAEKQQLNTLGYHLDSLDAIITHWYSRRSI